MTKSENRYVILADPHHAMREGIRGLVTSVFKVVFMVADEVSLFEGASKLGSELAIVDSALSKGDIVTLVSRLRSGLPQMKVLILGMSDEPPLPQLVLEAGACGYVLKRTVATDLLPALDAVLAGKPYISSAAANFRSKSMHQDGLDPAVYVKAAQPEQVKVQLTLAVTTTASTLRHRQELHQGNSRSQREA